MRAEPATASRPPAPPPAAPTPWVAGWDIGGAHVKLALLHAGRLHAVHQWPCPLWQSLDRLHAVLAEARDRLPSGVALRHALTMSGEMADLFPDRAAGVRAITAALTQALVGPAPQAGATRTAPEIWSGNEAGAGTAARATAVSADDGQPSPASGTGSGSVPAVDGPAAASVLAVWAGQRGWLAPAQAAAAWDDVASANWLASAQWAAQALPGAGLLVDIGSTTTDLVAWRDGRVLGDSRRDVDRLASGELVYHGVVRTPLCALGPQAPWQGRALNLMNEFFASSADVYRLTGELDERHDQQPAADQGAKTVAASQARLARMIGLDAADGDAAQWRALADHFRAVQLRAMADNLRRVWALRGLPDDARVLAVGCGRFLLPDLLQAAGLHAARPVDAAVLLELPQAASPAADPDDARAHARRLDWALVALPAVAVAGLLARDGASAAPAPCADPRLPLPRPVDTAEDARCG